MMTSLKPLGGGHKSYSKKSVKNRGNQRWWKDEQGEFYEFLMHLKDSEGKCSKIKLKTFRFRIKRDFPDEFFMIEDWDNLELDEKIELVNHFIKGAAQNSDGQIPIPLSSRPTKDSSNSTIQLPNFNIVNQNNITTSISLSPYQKDVLKKFIEEYEPEERDGAKLNEIIMENASWLVPLLAQLFTKVLG